MGFPVLASVTRKVTSAQSPAVTFSDPPCTGRTANSTIMPSRVMRFPSAGPAPAAASPFASVAGSESLPAVLSSPAPCAGFPAVIASARSAPARMHFHDSRMGILPCCPLVFPPSIHIYTPGRIRGCPRPGGTPAPPTRAAETGKETGIRKKVCGARRRSTPHWPGLPSPGGLPRLADPCRGRRLVHVRVVVGDGRGPGDVARNGNRERREVEGGRPAAHRVADLAGLAVDLLVVPPPPPPGPAPPPPPPPLSH